MDDLKVGTFVGEDARGNKYYEDPKLMLGGCSAVSHSCFSWFLSIYNITSLETCPILVLRWSDGMNISLKKFLNSRSQQMGRVPSQCRHGLWWIDDTSWMVWLAAPQDWQAPNWGEILYTFKFLMFLFFFVVELDLCKFGRILPNQGYKLI